VLAGGAALIGAATVGAAGWLVLAAEDGDGTPGAKEAARYVAERSLEQDPSIRAEARGLRDRLNEVADADRGDLLGAEVVADIDRGRVIEVDGWELARSEAAFAVIRSGLVAA
jgi:hypothetical protein